jgi:hypothetical protein
MGAINNHEQYILLLYMTIYIIFLRTYGWLNIKLLYEHYQIYRFFGDPLGEFSPGELLIVFKAAKDTKI